MTFLQQQLLLSIYDGYFNNIPSQNFQDLRKYSGISNLTIQNKIYDSYYKDIKFKNKQLYKDLNYLKSNDYIKYNESCASELQVEKVYGTNEIKTKGDFNIEILQKGIDFSENCLKSKVEKIKDWIKNHIGDVVIGGVAIEIFSNLLKLLF